MGLGNSKPERIPDTNIDLDDVEIIDMSEIEVDCGVKTDLEITTDEVIDNIVNDVIYKLENHPLNNFRKWVIMDSLQSPGKTKCLKLIESDIIKELNYDMFIEHYSWYYDHLGSLGKTAYDICKCKYNLERYENMIDSINA